MKREQKQIISNVEMNNDVNNVDFAIDLIIVYTYSDNLPSSC